MQVVVDTVEAVMLVWHCVQLLQLWALLHFIMPTLFDSHDEFTEWFSKDIESHVEKQSGLDESKLLVTCR